MMKQIITRARSQKMQQLNLVSQQNVNNQNTSTSLSGDADFADFVKRCLQKCEDAIGKENKINITTKLFTYLNANLEKVLEIATTDKWINFVCVIYMKCIEFENIYHKGLWFSVNTEICDKFLSELNKVKQITYIIIQTYNGVKKYDEIFIETNKMIANSRPRRNIKRVNYTYMDSVEPECCDNIADIWKDYTVEYDSDYEPYEKKQKKAKRTTIASERTSNANKDLLIKEMLNVVSNIVDTKAISKKTVKNLNSWKFEQSFVINGEFETDTIMDNNNTQNETVYIIQVFSKDKQSNTYNLETYCMKHK
jgi:hypothetical protein